MKKGALEMETIVKFIILLLLILVVTGLIIVLKGRGTSILESIKSTLRFGA